MIAARNYKYRGRLPMSANKGNTNNKNKSWSLLTMLFSKHTTSKAITTEVAYTPITVVTPQELSDIYAFIEHPVKDDQSQTYLQQLMNKLPELPINKVTHRVQKGTKYGTKTLPVTIDINSDQNYVILHTNNRTPDEYKDQKPGWLNLYGMLGMGATKKVNTCYKINKKGDVENYARSQIELIKVTNNPDVDAENLKVALGHVYKEVNIADKIAYKEGIVPLTMGSVYLHEKLGANTPTIGCYLYSKPCVNNIERIDLYLPDDDSRNDIILEIVLRLLKTLESMQKKKYPTEILEAKTFFFTWKMRNLLLK